MKRKMVLLLTGMLAVVTLYGCGGGSGGGSGSNGESSEQAETESASNTGGGVTLTLYCNADDMAKPYMQKIISLWEEESGNKIDQQGLDTDNAETIALTKFTTGDIPDLYVHFGNSNLKNFNPEENFVDWTDAEWVSDIQDSVLPQATYNDKIIGLPFWEASNSGCFYNKKIFDELGISQPKTQEEFDKVCDKLLENDIQPIYLAAADSWPILYQFALDPVLEEHPEYIEQLNAGELTYAEIPEFTSMCEWFLSAAEKGYFGKNFASDTWDYCSEVLGTGEAAMLFCWDTWFDTDYDSESYDYAGEDFGIMPVFMGTCEEGTYEGGNVNLMMANKNGDHVEEAKDFINFMSVPENYNQAFDGISTAAVFKGQTTNVNSTQYEENKDSVDQLIRASSAQPKIVGYNQGEGGKALLQLMSGDITVEECIKLIDDDRIATLKSFEQE
ncbi:carbohydrate ABC transporter substrate-binding protein [Schaedlerella arabinosiphila]|uniref:Carbohydrate ABC transporter substrate-binding protein n=1 Tax=Schaedlerella arabinosiphila TaxID=2044587 RepID=A0A3R8JK09_9FIRM|nr:ABC transporter substrate-binding protein [Schaedlerella arabinosiphila]RRK30723.1 carbohydrate ABC transporter substrate-binding protein [Schaedlerella arabinosiphila]